MKEVYNPNQLAFRNKVLNLGQDSYIMGIVNVTPDSFYDGGKYNSLDKALFRIEKIINEGADIIDIGGESTRPGAQQISLKEELTRIIPLINEVNKKFDTILSVDTTKALVAKEALESGVDIINDISGLNFEPEIAEYVAKYDAAIVLMHTTSRPKDMQNKIDYNSLIEDIVDYIKNSIKVAVNKGIDRNKIIIDPGIGFGKTVNDNLEIIRELKRFKELNCPILIGTSRKSFIGHILGGIEADERLIGSVITAMISILNGASIVRVHDVAETKQAIDIIKEINYPN